MVGNVDQIYVLHIGQVESHVDQDVYSQVVDILDQVFCAAYWTS